MKGLSPLVTSILIAGIYIFLIFLVYSWGMPMTQSNVEIPIFNEAESFLYLLNEKINSVRSFGGKEELTYKFPGEININAMNDQIYFSIDSTSSIYSAENYICLSKNCNLSQGILGKDEYSVLRVKVIKSDEYAHTTYFLDFRNLTDGTDTYMVDIVTPKNITLVGSEDSKLIIKNSGRIKERIAGGNLVRLILEVTLK
jgi:hypothetical protein